MDIYLVHTNNLIMAMTEMTETGVWLLRINVNSISNSDP